MEIRLESVEGYMLPVGTHIGVRVGDILKQGRYEPQRCYNFPAVERRRNAKIDVYRHVGSCVVAVDPDAVSTHEVSVSCSDPDQPALRLKVNIQSNGGEPVKKLETRAADVKNKAKEYLTKYGIEEKLSEAVKAVLKEQPADPVGFLCDHIRGVTKVAGPSAKIEEPPAKKATVEAPPKQPPAPPAKLHETNETTVQVTVPSANIAESPAKKATVEAPPKRCPDQPQQSGGGFDEAYQSTLDILRTRVCDTLTRASCSGKLDEALHELRCKQASVLPAALPQPEEQQPRSGLLRKGISPAAGPRPLLPAHAVSATSMVPSFLAMGLQPAGLMFI